MYEQPSRRLIDCSFGERPASWRRRRFINASREQRSCLGSIPPALRSRALGASGSPEKAFPDPLRRGDACAAGGGFNSPPALVIHAEDAFRGLPCSRASRLAPYFGLLSHAHNIGAYRNFASLHLAYGQKVSVLLPYTQQLGVMTQRKNPRACLNKLWGKQQSGGYARMLRHLHSCTRGRPSQRGNVCGQRA